MPPETDQKTRRNFERFLVDFWSKMGAQMVPKSEPIWLKIRPKTDLGPRWPLEAILERFWDDFGSFWGRLGGDVGRFPSLFPSFLEVEL